MIDSFMITPTLKVAIFTADNLRPYHAKNIPHCFNLGDYFESHSCRQFSDMWHVAPPYFGHQ